MAKRPDITLYTLGTPNGLKISVALEELSLVCKHVHRNYGTATDNLAAV